MRQDQADRLSRILVSARAFRTFFKGILSGFRVEASWKVFTDSDIRGVFVNHKLRTVTFGKNAYTMYTFQLVDQISDEDLTYLREKALEVPPGMMRAEAIYYDRWISGWAIGAMRRRYSLRWATRKNSDLCLWRPIPTTKCRW